LASVTCAIYKADFTPTPRNKNLCLTCLEYPTDLLNRFDKGIVKTAAYKTFREHAKQKFTHTTKKAQKKLTDTDKEVLRVRDNIRFAISDNCVGYPLRLIDRATGTTLEKWWDLAQPDISDEIRKRFLRELIGEAIDWVKRGGKDKVEP